MARVRSSSPGLRSHRVRREGPGNKQRPPESGVAVAQQVLQDSEVGVAEERRPGLRGRLQQRLAAFADSLPGPLTRRLSWFTRWRLALVAGVLLLVLLWSGAAATSTSIYSAQFVVTATTNEIAPADALFDFGGLPPTASITHKLTLKNDGKLNTYVMIMVFGNIRDFLDVNDAFFNLKPGQEREVDMKLTVPSTAQPDKQYKGRVVVTRLPWWSP
jgi:hypothetical protein